MSKHVPFDSIYRPNFEVVEERHGKVSLFPHTEQLPLLLRALHLEFYSALPDRIARVDKRGDDFHKILLKQAAAFFCGIFNTARKDNLRLMMLVDTDLVAQVTLVQQITENRPLGRAHRFRFYGKNGFFPDIHLSGRRLAFADHVLQRFSLRVPNRVGEDLSTFLLIFFGCPFITMRVGKSRAFVLPYMDSMLAFTYTESDEEFFVTTCLTAKEMNGVEAELPPQVFNLHYGKEFVRPHVRHWIPTASVQDFHKKWREKIPPAVRPPIEFFKNWKHLAQWIKSAAITAGHGPGSRLYFLDHVPGPMVMDQKPNQVEPAYDELAAYKKSHPDQDWDAIFATHVAQKSRPIRH